jgi:hypothetical protein
VKPRNEQRPRVIPTRENRHHRRTANTPMQPTGCRRRLIGNGCARHGTDRAGWESPCQVIAEPKARRRARASSRGGVWRKPNSNARGDVQEPDLRCGTPGTSGHVTAKSSIRRGACFINPASTRRTICVLPWEISRLSARTGWGETVTDRPGEVSRGRSRPEEGRAIEAPQCRKAGQQIGRAAKLRDEGPNGAPRGD